MTEPLYPWDRAAQQQAEPIPRHKPRKIVLDDERQAEPVGDEQVLFEAAITKLSETTTFEKVYEDTELDSFWALWKEARAAQSGQRAGVAEGHTVVPQEPTPAMLDAAERLDWTSADVRGNCCNMWNVMLAAAPTPAAQGGVA